jgi:ABC-type phosphate transport system substrate-binding protein
MKTETQTDIIAGSDGLSSIRINLQSVAAFFLAAILAGCSEKNEAPKAPGNSGNGATVPRGKVVIKGSNTVGEELAPRLISEFKKDHPNAKFELESNGT